NNESVISLFSGVRFNFYRLFLHYGYFNIWLISFSQFMVIVPFIIMGGGLFTGVITLGVLIQVSNAFDQVRSSFSVFIDNWTTITELRSIHKRLDEFEKNIKFN
ncbi:MAG: transporter, partial [Campylobacter sp.]|nr:transporter [Campylobacter sp.]